MKLIRKISIGSEYKDSMHYVNGQRVLDKTYSINSIIQKDDNSVEVWIERGEEVILWKTFSKELPKVINFKIDY